MASDIARGGAMTRIVTTIRIRRPIAAVFEYVTTPANWPRWHPASLSVSGNVSHSLLIGEAVTEEFRAAGRRGRVTWRVARREAPHAWVIETWAEGGWATISYGLRTERGETVFTRELTYAMPNPWLALLDRLVLRRRMARESAIALQQLKAALESSPRTGPDLSHAARSIAPPW
jgi:uncharacterized protein YndB with AHSA1/START domain